MSEEREGWSDGSFQAEAIEDLVFARQRIEDAGFLENMTDSQKEKFKEEVTKIVMHLTGRLG